MKKLIWACMFYMQLTHANAWGTIQTDALQVTVKPPSDVDFCRNGLFPHEQENLRLGTIRGQKTEKVHFFDDSDGCPSNGAKCELPTYLIPGDEVLVSKNIDDWACVWYQGRRHESVSWVPKKNVVLRPSSRIHPVRDWVGVWVDGPDKIRIVRLESSGELQIQSRLRWDGGTSPDGEAIAHYGGMQAMLDVHGSKASAAEDGCQVRLTRIGKYLAADDNGACGGMNVRHTGMYVRLPQ